MRQRWYRQAQHLARLGAARRAVALYDRVLAADETDRGAWLWSAVALAETGKFDAARLRIERAIRLAPDVPAGALFLARILHDSGQPAQAAGVLSAMSGRESNRHAQALLAACLVRLNEVPRAAEVLPRPLPQAPWVLARLLAAVEERTPPPPESPEPLDGTLRAGRTVRRGLLHLRAERWRHALACFRAAPPSPMASYGEGVALYYLRHVDEAEQHLRPVFTLLEEPFASDALAILGKVDLERARVSEGVLRLRRAIARGAGTAENYYALGVGFLRKGLLLPAIRAFQRCVTADFVLRRFGDLRAGAEAEPPPLETAAADELR